MAKKLFTENKDETFAYKGKRIAALSLALNALLAISKFLLYLFTHSSALLAETMHSFTDVIGSLLVIGGIYLSEKKSEQFPWGLYKIENLAAVFSSGLIFLSAFEIAKMVYNPSPLKAENLDITIIILFLMAVPILLFSRYEKNRAEDLNSPLLMADAENWRMDIAPLAVVAAGIAGAMFSYTFLDGISALVIIVLVIKAGYGILKDSLKSLLDASVDRTTLNEMKDVIKRFPQVREIISINARNSGRFIFVSMDLRLSIKRLKDAHEIATSIEREIKKRIPFVERIIIHYEPEWKEYKRYAVPLKNREGVISEHFGGAPFLALWDERISDKVILSKEIIENPFPGLEKGKGIRLAKFLVENGIDILYTKEIFEGKGPEYVFSDADVEVRKTDLQTLQDLTGIR
jgi:cation diffusion facilitator family transporter